MASVWRSLFGSSLAAAVAALSPASVAAESWQALGEPGSGGWITSIAVSPHDPDHVLLGGDILGIGVSYDGGDSWGPTFGFKSWEVGSISWHPEDPNTVWAGTMSGPYRSTDGGVTWAPKRNGMAPVERFSYSAPIEEVLFDPNNSNRLIAVGGSSRPYPSPGSPEWGAVWESLDGGDSWDRLSTITTTGSSPGDNGGDPGVVITSAAFAGGSSSTLFASGLNNGFYRSVDGGNTWSESNTGLPHERTFRVAAHPVNPNIVYTSLSESGSNPGGVYRSTNAGLTWAPWGVGLPQNVSSNPSFTSQYESLRIAPSNPNVIYTGDTRFGTTSSLARSDNGGGQWTTILQTGEAPKFDPAGINSEVIGIDPSNEDRVFVGTSAHVFRTEDAGGSWTDVTSRFVRDGPAGPEFRGTGFTGWVGTSIEFNPLDPDHLILQGLDAARGIQTKNGGDTWVRVMHDTKDYQGGRDVAFAGANAIYGTHGRFDTFDGISRSLDGGVTWDTLSGASRGLPDLGDFQAPPRGVYALPDEPNRVWAVVNNGLLASEDFGDTWAAVNSSVLGGETLRWIAEDPASPTTFYVSAENEVFRTIDAGESFQSIGGPGGHGRMEVDASGSLYLVSYDGNGQAGNGLWRYAGPPGRERWSQLFDDEWIRDVTVDPFDPQRIAVTTDDDIFHDETAATGVYISHDAGQSWVAVNDNLPMTRGGVITFSPHTAGELLYGTSGRGFFMIDLGLPGDFNGDEVVDAADYGVWRDTLGSNADLRADADLNGIVNAADYEVWRRNFGLEARTVSSGPRAVPEPAAIALLLCCGVQRVASRRSPKNH